MRLFYSILFSRCLYYVSLFLFLCLIGEEVTENEGKFIFLSNLKYFHATFRDFFILSVCLFDEKARENEVKFIILFYRI